MKGSSGMKGRGYKQLSASAQAVRPGGAGKMQTFKPSGEQVPGVSGVKGSGGGGKFAKGGGSGKMHKFSGVKPQKSGQSGI